MNQPTFADLDRHGGLERMDRLIPWVTTRACADWDYTALDDAPPEVAGLRLPGPLPDEDDSELPPPAGRA